VGGNKEKEEKVNIITDLSFSLLAIPRIILAGMVKGGLGQGVIAISVPVSSFVMGPVQTELV